MQTHVSTSVADKETVRKKKITIAIKDGHTKKRKCEAPKIRLKSQPSKISIETVTSHMLRLDYSEPIKRVISKNAENSSSSSRRRNNKRSERRRTRRRT